MRCGPEPGCSIATGTAGNGPEPGCSVAMGTAGNEPDAGRGAISCPGGRGASAGEVRDRPRPPGEGAASRGGSRGTVLLRGCLPTAGPRYHAIRRAVRHPCGLAHAPIARRNLSYSGGATGDPRARPPEWAPRAAQPPWAGCDSERRLHPGFPGPFGPSGAWLACPECSVIRGAIASNGAASLGAEPPAPRGAQALLEMSSVVQAPPRRITASSSATSRSRSTGRYA